MVSHDRSMSKHCSSAALDGQDTMRQSTYQIQPRRSRLAYSTAASLSLPVLDRQDTNRQSAGKASDLEGFKTRLCPSCPAMWGSPKAPSTVFVHGPSANTTAVAGTCSPSTVTPVTASLQIDVKLFTTACTHLGCICYLSKIHSSVQLVQEPTVRTTAVAG